MLTFSEEITLLPHPVRGVVETIVSSDQRGRVKAMGSFWFAELYQTSPKMTISVGQPVQVVARRGITLLVIPASEEVRF